MLKKVREECAARLRFASTFSSRLDRFVVAAVSPANGKLICQSENKTREKKEEEEIASSFFLEPTS